MGADLSKVEANDPSVTELTLDSNESSLDFRAFIQAMKSNTHVLKLDVSMRHLTVDETHLIADTLKANRSVQSVSLYCCKLGDAEAAIVAAGVQAHPSLQKLLLRNNRIGASGLQALCAAVEQSTVLRELNLSQNKDDTGPFSLALASLVRKNRSMRTIDAHNSCISDAGLALIAEALQSNPTLTELDLTYMGVWCSGNAQTSLSSIKSLLKRNKKGAAAASSFATLSSVDAAAAVSTGVVAPIESASPPVLSTASSLSGVQPSTGSVVEAKSVALSTPAENVAELSPRDAAAPPELQVLAVEGGHELKQAQAAATEPAVAECSLASKVATLPDIHALQQQLSTVQFELGSHGAALSPLHQARVLKHAQTQLLIELLSEPSARDYFQHVKLLLLCAHTGAAAVLSGNVQSQGSDAAGRAKFAVEKVPGLILRALGKAAESIPFIGAGASALTALISAADERSLTVQLQRIAPLARDPAELTSVINATARKLTVLQWELLTREAALHATTQAHSFRELVKKQLGKAVAEAMYAVKGERRSDRRSRDTQLEAVRFPSVCHSPAYC
jgi:hypothetical protein